MGELLLSVDALVVPTTDGRPMTFDMRKIHKAESRIVELATVTRPKAGELQACFIDAFGDAKDHLAQIKGAFGRAKQRLRTIKGIVILDRAADVLKTKEIASSRSPGGSEDQRAAVFDNDKDYLAVAETLQQIEVVMDRMDAKVEKLKMAYYAASDLTKTMDSRRDVSGGVGDDEPGSLSPSERAQQFVSENSKPTPKGFGKAKY